LILEKQGNKFVADVLQSSFELKKTLNFWCF